MRINKNHGYALIEILILLLVISGIMYYTVMPGLTKKKSETNNELKNYISTSQDTRNLNPDNPYGLNFQIIEKETNLTWQEAQEFCKSKNSALINTKQAEEIIKAIYLAPNSNCKEQNIEGLLRYNLCIPYIIENQPLKKYLNDDNPYQIIIWTSDRYDNVNGQYLYLTESGASISGMAYENRAKALCVK